MSKSGATFCDEPWGFLLSSGETTGTDVTLSGTGSPRVFTKLGAKSIRWVDGAGIAPQAGMPFKWKGRDYAGWHIPCSNVAKDGRHNLTLRCSIDGAEPVIIYQEKLLHRPPEDTENHAQDSVHQAALINWMVNSFQELGHMAPGVTDSDTKNMIRRSWKTVQEIWVDPKTNEPRMELIIKMAQDKHLVRALNAIGSSPRRILLRVREATPVGRVQEMDAVCIRNYAKLPGNSPAQKAGPRQELMAVQRRPSHNTLENKVAAWTMAALQKRAENWRRSQTRVALEGARARSVSNLAKENKNLLEAESMMEVKYTALPHPASANYPLSMEPRYKLAYKAYRELLRYQKIKDDAWTWRRPLWCETVSQLINCCLLRLWTEEMKSTPFFRKEADRGRWIAAQSSAGPFKTTHGQAVLIDSQDFASMMMGPAASLPANSQSPIYTIGATGCDLAIWWPEKSAIIPIWATLSTDTAMEWQASLLRASKALANYQAQSGDTVQRTAGLIITAHAETINPIISTDHSATKTTIGLRMPMHAGTLDAQNFAEVVKALSDSLKLSMDSLFK